MWILLVMTMAYSGNDPRNTIEIEKFDTEQSCKNIQILIEANNKLAKVFCIKEQ